MNKKLEEVHELATEIANLPVQASMESRRRIRALVLRVAKKAIEAQNEDPTTLECIKVLIRAG